MTGFKSALSLCIHAVNNSCTKIHQLLMLRLPVIQTRCRKVSGYQCEMVGLCSRGSRGISARVAERISDLTPTSRAPNSRVISGQHNDGLMPTTTIQWSS